MIKENFDKYIEEFRKLSLEERQHIALEQLNLLTNLAEEMCQANNIKSEMLVDQELVSINKQNYTEDEFVETVIIYINSIQNLICDYNLEQ